MYVLALSDYKQLAAAAGWKPAPQLGRQIVWIIIVMIFHFGKKNTEFAFHNANSVHRTYIEMKKLSFYLTK